MRLFRIVTASSVFTAGCSLLFLNSVYAQEAHEDGSFQDQGLFKTEKREDSCDSIRISTSGAPRIAVIGAGIGGASATHFLRKLLGPSATIDIYEKSDRIGGRLSVISLDNETIESGGTIIHSSNQYMTNFTKELDLEKNTYSNENGKLGIYNGKEFVFIEDDSSTWSTLAMIWRYGILSLWRMQKSLKQMLSDFQNIYKLQESGQAFDTVPEMLRAMGGDYFYEYTQKTVKQVMNENGIGEKLIDELVTAVDRCNYGQDSGVNGFTGYVSLAGAQGGELWNVKGGNYQVCQRLLKSSNATIFINSKIDSIRKELIDGKTVYFLDKKGKQTPCNQPYDAIVVAAPLEVPSCYLNCPKCLNWPDQQKQGRYHQTIASFIQAKVNYKYFGLKSADQLPDNIFTTENKDLPFLTIGSQNNINGEETKKPIYKMFSRELISDDVINDLFDLSETPKETARLHSITWLAYPQYTPPERFAPFKLDQGVFYVNAIERAASAMEMSAIGGRNAALLVNHYLNGVKEKET